MPTCLQISVTQVFGIPSPFRRRIRRQIVNMETGLIIRKFTRLLLPKPRNRSNARDDDRRIGILASRHSIHSTFCLATRNEQRIHPSRFILIPQIHSFHFGNILPFDIKLSIMVFPLFPGRLSTEYFHNWDRIPGLNILAVGKDSRIGHRYKRYTHTPPLPRERLF